MKIAVTASNTLLISKAKELAKQLSLDFIDEENENYDYLLKLTNRYLCLQKTAAKMLPVMVDFLSGKITYRRQHTSLRNESLTRAMGLKHDSHPKIIDATAGLAQDSFILASLGFEVTLLERSPIICALVQDGIKRALENKHVAEIVSRLHLVQIDAISYLEKKPDVDIVYLDPMFPERKKSARVKKEMEILHDILGEDVDAAKLLQAALACASQRVVVKRPRLAESLEGISPSFQLTGRACRFDVYVI